MHLREAAADGLDGIITAKPAEERIISYFTVFISDSSKMKMGTVV